MNSTINLPAINRARLGTAVKVVRMDPDVYSLVINSVPMTPTANWAKRLPRRLLETGSKVATRIALNWVQWVRTRVVISTPSPTVSTTVTITPMIEDRTVRNLIHSERVVAQSVDSLAIDRVRLQGAVFDGAGGEVHEDLLERRTLRREFEDRDTGVECQLTDLIRRQSRDGETFVIRVVHDTLVGRHYRGQLVVVR